MNWFKSKTYWKRGGLIGGIFGLIGGGLLTFGGMYLNTLPPSFSCGWTWESCNFFEFIIDPLKWIQVLIIFIFGFLLGIVTGWIIGKIRRPKKKRLM